MAQVVNNPPAGAGTTGDVGSIPRSEDPLEVESMAIYSGILAQRIPRTVHRVARSPT